jgi:small nuclear ribonucleoprotein
MDETAQRPLDVIESAVGTTVQVQLKDGQTHEGQLAGYDQHLNLVVEDESAGDTTVIRGDNVVSIGL